MSARKRIFSKAPRSKQQGVALVFVLLLVAVLVAIAAIMTERMSTQFYRATNLLNHQQAYWYSMGVESLAQAAIEMTYEDNDENINLSQVWAIKDTNYPLENGQAVGSIYDKQTCFNINALTSLPNTNTGQRAYLLKVLVYILEDRGIDSYQSEVIADSIKEFVDSDDQVMTENGIESATYEGLLPPYKAPNGMIADISELRAVYQVPPQMMNKLDQIICAIPSTDLLINVNTLEPQQALLLTGIFQPALSLGDAANLLENRPTNGWESIDDFLGESEIQSISEDIKSEASSFLTVSSQYFELDAQIKVEDSRIRLRSLIYSSDKSTTQIIRRRFGGISERVSDNKAE